MFLRGMAAPEIQKSDIPNQTYPHGIASGRRRVTMGNNRLYALHHRGKGIHDQPGDAEDYSWEEMGTKVGVVFGHDATFERRKGENRGRVGRRVSLWQN